MKTLLLVGVYLTAIISANLLVAHYGAWIVPITSFCLIGLNFTTRNMLHFLWSKHLWLRMGLLIGAGSLLSWLINYDAGRVALASFAAFACAAAVDTFAHHVLRHKVFMVTVNGSNMWGAIVDSVIFISLAFGQFLWPIILIQIATKIGGGFAWSLVYRRFKDAILHRPASAKAG